MSESASLLWVTLNVWFVLKNFPEAFTILLPFGAVFATVIICSDRFKLPPAVSVDVSFIITVKLITLPFPKSIVQF